MNKKPNIKNNPTKLQKVSVIRNIMNFQFIPNQKCLIRFNLTLIFNHFIYSKIEIIIKNFIWNSIMPF